MTLSYEKCKELKEAGYRQGGLGITLHNPYSYKEGIGYDDVVYRPTLSELIEACTEDLEEIIIYVTDDLCKARVFTTRTA